MITWQDVVNIAPALTASAIPTGMQAALLTRVQTEVDDDAWGEYADFGRAYLAAHLATIRFNTGAITSESVGPLSRSYAMLPITQSLLATTMFGMEYLRLLRLAVGPCVLPV